jgi:hypothetical protein
MKSNGTITASPRAQRVAGWGLALSATEQVALKSAIDAYIQTIPSGKILQEDGTWFYQESGFTDYLTKETA